MNRSKLLFCRARYLLPLTSEQPDIRIHDGYVLSEGETLTEVGPYTPDVVERLTRTYGDSIQGLDADPFKCHEAVLLPAFVKAHGHDHEQPLIGIAKDEPLTSWLDHAVNPFTGFLNQNSEELANRLGRSPHLLTYLMARVCDIHYGITSSMVHHCNFNKYHLQEIASANEAAGTTMIVAVGSQDRNYVASLLDKPEEAVNRLQQTLAMDFLNYTSFCPGPDQLFSNSRKILVPLKKWARENDTLFHVHSSEEPATTKWFREEIEPGMTPVEYADSIGILDEKSVLAHQVNCGPRDLEILARTGTRVVHNPLANTILGSGMPPVRDMIRMGIPVAVSTDGSGSADNQNILAAARLAAQYQKAYHQDATILPSKELLQMITSIPSDMLGLDQGTLQKGKRSDWILVGLNRPNLVPTRQDNVMENLIWAADGSEIDTVVSRGRLLKHHGKVLPFLDGTKPDDVMAGVQKLSEAFFDYRKSAPELSGTGVHK